MCKKIRGRPLLFFQDCLNGLRVNPKIVSFEKWVSGTVTVKVQSSDGSSP